MKEAKNVDAIKPRCRKPAQGYKVVYISIPEPEYASVLAAAKANCRSIGGELLYGWRTSNARKS